MHLWISATATSRFRWDQGAKLKRAITAQPLQTVTSQTGRSNCTFAKQLTKPTLELSWNGFGYEWVSNLQQVVAQDTAQKWSKSTCPILFEIINHHKSIVLSSPPRAALRSFGLSSLGPKLPVKKLPSFLRVKNSTSRTLLYFHCGMQELPSNPFLRNLGNLDLRVSLTCSGSGFLARSCKASNTKMFHNLWFHHYPRAFRSRSSSDIIFLPGQRIQAL